MTTSVNDTVISNAGANATLEIPAEALLRNDSAPAGTGMATATGATLAGDDVRYVTPPDFSANGGSFGYQAVDGGAATVTVAAVSGGTITGSDDGEILVANPAQAAAATTIGDINALPSPDWSQYPLSNTPFGERPTGSVIYIAQTFTVPADTAGPAQNLRFGLGPSSGSGDIEFRLLVVTDDGTGTDYQGGKNFSPGQILFTSPMLIKPAFSGATDFNVSLEGLSLTPGQTYAFVLDTIGIDDSESGVNLATPRSGNGGYLGGDTFALGVHARSSPGDQAQHFAGNFTRIFNTDLAFQIEFGTPAAGSTLDGRGGDDTLIGASGGDTLLGGLDEDWLYGKGGDDLLVGGADNDRIDAGAGNDRVIYSVAEGFDTIDGGSEPSGGADVLEIRNTTDLLQLEFRLGSTSGGEEIDPSAADPDAVNTTDLLLQLRERNSSSGYTDTIRFDEIETVELKLGAGDSAIIGNLIGTALSRAAVTVTGADGNESVDITATGSRHLVRFDGGAGEDTVRLAGHWTDYVGHYSAYKLSTEIRNGETWYRFDSELVSGVTDQHFVLETNDVERFYFAADDATLDIIELLNADPIAVDDNAGTVVEAGLAGPGIPETAAGNVLSNDTDPNRLDGFRVGGAKSGTGAPPANVSGSAETAVTGKYGTLFIKADGAYRYLLNNDDIDTMKLKTGDHATEVFSYIMYDSAGRWDYGTITVGIDGADDPNTPPTITSTNDWSWNELDGPFGVFESDFLPGFADFDGDGFGGIRITSLPTDGVLTFNGVPITAASLPFAIPAAQIGGDDESQGLWFIPANRSHDYVAVFEYQAQDSRGGWSTESASYTIRVEARNSAPAGTDGTIRVDGESYTFKASDFGFTDQEGDGFGGLIVKALPTLGTLYYDADGGDAGNAVAVVSGQAISADAIEAGKLLYMPHAQRGAVAYTSFQFQVQDDGGTAGGGQNTDASANSLTIDYNAAPYSAYTVIPDNNPDYYVSSNVAALDEKYPTTPPIQLAFVGYLDDALGGESFTLLGPDAAYFEMQGSFIYLRTGVQLDYETKSSYTVTIAVDDPTIGSGPEAPVTLTLLVNNLEEFSVVGPMTITLDEDSTYTFSINDFPYYDPDGTRPLAGVEFNTTNVGHLWYDPTGGDRSDAQKITSITLISRAEIEAGKVFYKQDVANQNGGGYASFQYRGYDGAQYTNIPRVTFDLTPVNDSPAWSRTDGAKIYPEGDAVILDSDITVADIELDALNGGLGNYAGTVLTLRRDAGATPVDAFGFDTSTADFAVSGNELQDLSGHTFATFDMTDGVLTLTFADNLTIATSALVDDVLQHIRYGNSSHTPPDGLVAFRWSLADGNSGVQGSGGEGIGVAVTHLDFEPANDAPFNFVPGAQSVDENAALAFSFAGGNAISVGDIDAGSGELNVRLEVAHGTLTVNATGGLTRLEGNGRETILLRGDLTAINTALDGLLYRGALNYAGSDRLRITTDDQGNTGSGGRAQDEDTVAITVNNIAVAPQTQDGTVSGTEETTIAVTLSGSDSDGSVVSFRLFGLPQNGALFLDAAGTTPVNPNNIPASVGSAVIYFIPDPDFSGRTAFQYFAVDNEGTVDTTPALIWVEVAGLNDAPVLGGDGRIQVAEGGTVTLTSLDLTATDVDTANADLVYTVTAAAHGRVQLNATDTLTFTQADLVSGRVTFVHDGSEDAGSITVSLTDGAVAAQTATVAIAVDPHHNDAPVLGGDGVTQVAEGGTVTLTTSDLSATDVDSADTDLVYTVSATAHGSVRLDGTDTTTFTQGDLASGRVTFVHDGSEDAASITVSLTDGAAPVQTATIAIAVDPHHNDAPVAHDATAGGDEDTAIAVTLSGDDIDGTVALFRIATLPADGALFLDAAGTTPIDPDGIAASAGSAVIYFVPAANFSGTSSFQYLVIDDDGFTSDAPATVSIQVDAVDDAPGAVADSTTVDQDSGVTAIGVLGNDTDVDGGPKSIAAVTQGSHGSVTITDSGVTYRPDAGYFGQDSFTYTLDGGSSATVTVTVRQVVAANAIPVVDHNTGTSVTEGGSDTVSAAELSYLDAEQPGTALTYTITTALAHGTLLRNGVALGLGGTFTQADINSGLISYSHGGSEESSDSFGFMVSDGAGGEVPGQNFTFTIAGSNDAPSNTVPGTQQIEANVATAIAGLSIADADAASSVLTTTLSVLHGTLTATGGADIAGSGSATVTLTGSLAEINATLANVVYRGAEDDFGTDTLTIVTDDGGYSGSGGARTDTDQMAINLNTWLTGTGGDDAFTALPGNARIDALTGLDTVTFGFKLTDATFRFVGNQVIVDGPAGSHTVLSGVERYVFTDGTVDNDDRDPLVDDLFYYAQNHDVWNAHVEADQHYHAIGWREGRDPSAFFSTSLYLSANPDVKAAQVDPLIHFDRFGWAENRVPSIAFDPRAYLAANPDVAAAGIDPLLHFLAAGAQEGRTPVAPSELVTANGFDYVHYLQQNPDVAAAGVDPFWHFMHIGWHEGRNPNALFDVTGYLAAYPDVAAAGINPLDHYHLAGWKEGRDPSLAFDTADYLTANPDVAAARIDPLLHFLQNGIHEGRAAFADGTWG